MNSFTVLFKTDNNDDTYDGNTFTTKDFTTLFTLLVAPYA